MIAPVRISCCWRNSLGVLPHELYLELFPLLRDLAEQKFRVPEHESEDVVQDVFVSCLSKPVPVDDVRAYLIGATSHACRMYWRRAAKFDRDAELPERRRVPRYDRILALRRVLHTLPRLERRVLLLRAQGWRIREIAARIGRSPSWTEKLLRRARKAAAEEMDVTNRRREGEGLPGTDTYATAGHSALVPYNRHYVSYEAFPSLKRSRPVVARSRMVVLRCLSVVAPCQKIEVARFFVVAPSRDVVIARVFVVARSLFVV